jgi:hypothetical protein
MKPLTPRVNVPVENLLLLLRTNAPVLEQQIQKLALQLRISHTSSFANLGLTLGFSNPASSPGLRFLRSENTPSSNFLTIAVFTGRPNASNLKANARTAHDTISLSDLAYHPNHELTNIRPRDLKQPIPICTRHMFPVRQQEPIERRMRGRDKGDGVG